MGLLRITNLEYKSSNNNLDEDFLNKKTNFWIGKNNNGTNALTFTIGNQYRDYLESRFAKVVDAKLYLKIVRHNLNDKIDDIRLTYHTVKIKKICDCQDDFLIIDFSVIFKKNRKTIELDKNFCIDIDNDCMGQMVFDKNQSYIEIDYKPIGNTNNNRPIINHQFGWIDLVEGINHIDVFDIGCKNIHIHHLYNSRRNADETYHCGKKWSLNINQKLLKDEEYASEYKSDLYLYQDGTGMVEELVERFYIEDKDNRIYLKKEDVKLLDGVLEYIYRGKPYLVNVEHISKHGFRLQTNIEEYKKDISSETRNEEIATLEEQIKSLNRQKKEMETSLDLLERNQNLDKLSKEIRVLENLIENQILQNDMSQNSDYCQYKEIKDKIFAIERQYNSYINDCNNEYYNKDGNNVYIDNQSENYLENDLIINREELEMYKKK